ncbi:uncharacterized protein LOC107610695 [Arachis ipaensis]|uniref:uncharacterized protein LOC107610695 n=1 Tax=Arachis ipaensis TaxID=130454 RepID=UPI0007AF852C|nr:uncharacterized protein LOC107610695 [Arachis ipaensis]
MEGKKVATVTSKLEVAMAAVASRWLDGSQGVREELDDDERKEQLKVKGDGGVLRILPFWSEGWGNRMITSIPKALVQKWSGLIVQFQMTTVNHIQELSFSLEAFRFRTIVEILNTDKNQQSDLFDVIAEVVSKEDSRDLLITKGKETKHLIVVLEDLEHNKIDCILFGKMVNQILPHLEAGTGEPVIVLLQFIKAIRLFSDAPATSSVRISQNSSQSGWSAVDELTQGDIAMKTIEQVLNCEKKDWYYKSCRNCLKKVDTPIGDKYEECGKCGHIHGSDALRFKIEVMVYNGTGSISLLLWDREMSDGDNEYPSTLNNIIDKKLLLKLNVKFANIKQFVHIYTVMKICDDEEIIEKNTQSVLSTEPFTNNTEGGCSNLVHVSGDVVNLENDCDPEYNLDVIEESISSLKCKTPAKRTSQQLEVCLPICE